MFLEGFGEEYRDEEDEEVDGPDQRRSSNALFIHMPRHIYYDNLVGIKVRNEQYTYTYNF